MCQDGYDYCDLDHPGECPRCEDARSAFEEDVQDGIFIGENMVKLEQRMKDRGIHTPQERLRAVREDGSV